MTKLFFKYGTVSSGKSVRLLVDVYQYEQTHNDNSAIVIKPAIDTRHGQDMIWSRVGLERKADYCIGNSDAIPVQDIISRNPSCVFVDEVQFLSMINIDELALLSLTIPVVCYGLRVSWKGSLFPPISVLMAKEDKIEEIKTICVYCEAKATQNKKIVNNSVEDNEIELGDESTYLPVCRKCFTQSKHSTGN